MDKMDVQKFQITQELNSMAKVVQGPSTVGQALLPWRAGRMVVWPCCDPCCHHCRRRPGRRKDHLALPSKACGRFLLPRCYLSHHHLWRGAFHRKRHVLLIRYFAMRVTLLELATNWSVVLVLLGQQARDMIGKLVRYSVMFQNKQTSKSLSAHKALDTDRG
jgi:hypothetical protein